MPLSEHVYCVAIAFKMMEKVEQQLCMKFCVELEHFSEDTILIESEGPSDGLLVIGSFIKITHLLMYHLSCGVFWEMSNHPGDSVPLQFRFGAL